MLKGAEISQNLLIFDTAFDWTSWSAADIGPTVVSPFHFSRCTSDFQYDSADVLRFVCQCLVLSSRKQRYTDTHHSLSHLQCNRHELGLMTRYMLVGNRRSLFLFHQLAEWASTGQPMRTQDADLARRIPGHSRRDQKIVTVYTGSAACQLTPKTLAVPVRH